jgi:hypothetical protein
LGGSTGATGVTTGGTGGVGVGGTTGGSTGFTGGFTGGIGGVGVSTGGSPGAAGLLALDFFRRTAPTTTAAMIRMM